MREQRKTAQGSVHVKRLQLPCCGNENQFSLGPLHDRRNRNRPHRRETRAAGDKDDAAGMIWPEKGAAERSGNSDTVSDLDGPPQFGRYQTPRESSDVKMHNASVRPPL